VTEPLHWARRSHARIDTNDPGFIDHPRSMTTTDGRFKTDRRMWHRPKGRIDVIDTELRALLADATTIAVVGASTDPTKAASRIPALLIEAGYTVIPVHPTAREILAQPVYATLADVPVPIDIVDVFRPAAEAPGIAEQAAAVGARALWLQLGITSIEARQIADRAGMTYLEDICIGETARRLGARPSTPR